MEKADITLAVRHLIEEAAHNKGWSLAELTRRVGKGASTLHRWRAGSTVCFDMPVLLQLCEYAGTSLDTVFGFMPSYNLAAGAPAELGLGKEAQANGAVELRIVRELVQVTSSILSTVKDTLDSALTEQKQPSRKAVIDNAREKLNQLVAKRQQEDIVAEDLNVQLRA